MPPRPLTVPDLPGRPEPASGGRAFVSGCAGAELTREEGAFFADARPWGLILFRRNIRAPDQVRDLVAAFRDATGRGDAPILIDQEGGRVQRLGPPHWCRHPASRVLGRIAERNPEEGRRAAWLQGRLIAAELYDLGITIDCLPVLDVVAASTNEAIGDRSFGGDASSVAELGRATAEGLMAGGVLPVVKHVPGQGRAGVDSHLALPVVGADTDTLTASDFAPFAALADLPLAMTGHVVYSAIDPLRPATTSPIVIRDIIRDRIGFDGLLMSDDVSMHALSGDHGERAAAIHAAGCDLVLHCNGRIGEMRAIAGVTPALAGEAARRAARALARLHRPEPFDADRGRAELVTLSASVGWTPEG